MRPLCRQHVPGIQKFFAAAEDDILPIATPSFAYSLPSSTSASVIETSFSAGIAKKSSKNNAIYNAERSAATQDKELFWPFLNGGARQAFDFIAEKSDTLGFL